MTRFSIMLKVDILGLRITHNLSIIETGRESFFTQNLTKQSLLLPQHDLFYIKVVQRDHYFY